MDFSDLGDDSGAPVKKSRFDFSDLGGEPTDSAPAAPATHSVGGFLQNAVTDVKNTAGALGSIGRKVMEAPYDAIQGARQMMGGAKFGDTTIGQNLRGAGEAIQAAVPHLQTGAGGGLELEPGAVARQYQDIGAQPFKMLPGQAGEAFKKAYPNNPLYDQPVTSLIAVAPAAKALFGASGAADAVNATRAAVARPFEAAAQNLGRRTLGLTKQYLNKTQGQLPAANQAAQVALDRGVIRNPILNPMSSGAEDMLHRANALDSQAGAKIGSFLKSQDTPFDWGKTMSDLDELKRQYPADVEVTNKIDNAKEIVRKTAIRYGGDIPFEQANKLKSYLQQKVNYNTDAASSGVGKRVAGTVRSGLDSQLENAAQAGGNGKDFQSFLQNKKEFGAANLMQKGLLNKSAAEAGNRAVSPYSILTGIGEYVHSGNPMTALMIAGGTELTKRYGAATGAAMANSLAKLIKANPGKYSALLSNAIREGGPTLNAVSVALQSEPEFQRLLNQKQPSQRPALEVFGTKPQPRPLFRKAS
jgi:hypothetical protein